MATRQFDRFPARAVVASNSHTSVVLPVFDDKPLTATMMGRRSFMNLTMKQ